MSKKILIIKNPVSASGKKNNLVAQVIQELKQNQCDVLVYETLSAGDGISYLLDLQEKFDVIVAAGGDGTVNEVINGMVNIKTTPLAVIPVGTTNVLAKELALPKKAKTLAEIILKGLAKPVYLGRLNDRRFSMMVGVGYDAWIVNEVNLDIKKSFGKLAYVLSMIKQLFTFGKQTFLAEIDGRQTNVSSMIVTQGKYYAGSFVLSRKSSLSSPTMQAIVIDTESFFKFFLTVLSLPLGMMENLPFVQSIACKEIKIKSVESKPRYDVLQMDGDKAGTMPAHLKIEEEPISILVSQ
jgi:YegS/Rv2252/BmrU family lipid kinase